MNSPIIQDYLKTKKKEVWDRGIQLYNLLSDHLEYQGPFTSKSDIETFIDDMYNSRRKYAYDYTPEGNHVNIVFSDIELPSATTALESAEFLDESFQGFERNSKPKETMGIGVSSIIPNITSYDLEMLGFGWDYDKSEFNINLFSDEYRFSEDTEEDFQNSLNKVRKISIALDKKIKFDNFFDWKEYNEMEEYLKNRPFKKFPYAYNAYPGGDEIQVVWSKILLPSAEKIN